LGEIVSNVTQHYDQLLAEHYIWMFGVPLEQKVAEQRALLDPIVNSLPSALRHGSAIDLGSGPGFQSIALAELGHLPVIAVDTSKDLLAELLARRGSHSIEIREADIAILDSIELPGSVSVITCMGDTLTHLPSKTAVQQLCTAAFFKLKPGGLLILTYRDLTTPLHGTDRFLPVYADDNKTMTCFLEYKSEDAVTVTDLVYTRSNTGWRLSKSSYEKLRLSPTWLASMLQNSGFAIKRAEPVQRLQMIVAQKPA